MQYNPNDTAGLDAAFYDGLQQYSLYKLIEQSADNPSMVATDLLERFKARAPNTIPQILETSFKVLDSMSQEQRDAQFAIAARSDKLMTILFDQPEGGQARLVGVVGYPLSDIAQWWHTEYGASREAAEPGTAPTRAPRQTDLLSVHSSMPVYDIGETIARGVFQVLPGDSFPTASIIGDTKGRLELIPYWDVENSRSISLQNIGLMRKTDETEFLKLREQAIEIATSYNEEMATYFYAMDAYWLDNTHSADDYVELRIEDLLKYTGKKPVKSGGRYSAAYRPDQIRRAGMMIYNLGFTMVEIERTIVRGKGTRMHFKRLWEVEDVYTLNTLDGDMLLESIRYRPCEILRSATFGTRRETALLMSRVLALDFKKMVAARRLGRYYTWLWRDRAHRGELDAPISCETLLTRAGIEIVPGKEYGARRALESALDRLEQEGIIAQWLLFDKCNNPVNIGERISFKQWCELRVSVTPTASVNTHYAVKFLVGTPAAQKERDRVKNAEAAHPDIENFKFMMHSSGKGLREIASEIGLDAGTLSRILNGKTLKPRAKARDAIRRWMEASARQHEPT